MRKMVLAGIAVALLAVPGAALAAAAAPFDAEAATRAYLATLQGAARAQSDAYFEGGYWLILWGALIGIAVDLLILRSGLSARYRDWAERISRRGWVQSMLWTVPYLITSTLIALPWTIYTGYVREKQYDLMNQSFAGWLCDQAIGLAVGFVGLAVALAIIMGIIRRAPRTWWLWGTGALTAMMAVMVMLAPVFISPLFNTYTELPAGPVRDRIVAMAQSQHVPAEHIWLFDASRQTKRVSANVSGFGPTVRISLNDNLLNRTSLPETAAVMGHELGHYVLGHTYRLIGLFALVFLAVFWIGSRMVPAMIARWGASWGVRGPGDIAAVPVYFIVLTLLMTLLTPVTNSIVRTTEAQADGFGLDVAREPDGFAQAALQLSEYRKLEPGTLEEIIFFDHPSGENRIRRSMQWKAAHLAEVEARARAEHDTVPPGADPALPVTPPAVAR